MERLIHKLEQLSAPSREMDAEIARLTGTAHLGYIAEAENYKGERLVLAYQKGWNDGGMGDGYWWEQRLKKNGDIFPSEEEARAAVAGARGFNWSEAKPGTEFYIEILASPPPAFTSSLDAKLPAENIRAVVLTGEGWDAWQDVEGTNMSVCGQHPTSEPIARRLAALKAMEAA